MLKLPSSRATAPVLRGLTFALLVTVGGVSLPAGAQEAPFPAASNQIILWSARSCYAEATWSNGDCTALLHVIRKRAAKARWSFIRMLKAYSVRNWVQSAHGKIALGLQLGFNDRFSAAWNENWRQLAMHVVDVLEQREEDPCPTADHWAAKYYNPKSPMRRVKCGTETANAFWVALANP